MKVLLCTLVILGLLSAGAAFAQGYYGYGYGDEYADEAYRAFRVQVGWAEPGDLDSCAVFGASHIWKNALLTVNYLKSDETLVGGRVEAKIWSIEGSYLWRAKTDPTMYYGGGYGWLRSDADFTPVEGASTSVDDNSGVWNLVVGKEFPREGEFGKPAIFAEARWNFGTSIRFSDVNGPRVVVGWRF